MDAFLLKAKEIHSVDEAIALLWEQLPSALPQTKSALALAQDAHEGQKRKSGEPYIVHPILVAAITARFSNDEKMVQAALLHDVVEDTDYTIEDLSERFGDDIAHLVEGLTKIVTIRDKELIASGSDERLIGSALTFRKMLIASIKDIRVLVIKLCDRLHNMLTLDALKAEKQRRIAEETLVVYAPIAHRLGISLLKNSLEDLSFYYIYPKEYGEIDAYIQKNRQSLQISLNAFIQKVTYSMLRSGFDEDEFQIFGRVKHYYSIYMKMQRKGVSIEEVLDLLAVRIIVQEPLECYKVQGLLHLSFTPLISRFKDYIAVPKENGYKTIHTTLFNDDDGIIEAQIRTEQMHQLAEFGVAAHWKYKSGTPSDDAQEVNISWLESLNYQKDSIEEFYELAKGDLFSEDIILFSPKGDCYTLPKESTALDFAYAVHSEVGSHAMDALVNKRNSSLLSVLKNGDIVRIIKDDKVHLHCSWIDAVKTSKAKEGIRSICRARLKETNTLSAYNILATLFSKSQEEIREVVEALGLEENIYKVVTQRAYFNEVTTKIASSMGSKREIGFWKSLSKGFKKPKEKTLEHFIFVSNQPIQGLEFDYCCHPKMGDEIVAFYDKGKVIIHHKLCKQAYKKIQDAEAMVFVSWKSSKRARYRLLVSLQNKKGILADLLQKLSKMDLNVVSIELGIQRSDQAELCQIEVESQSANREKIAQKLAQKFKLIEMVSLDDAYNK